MSSKRPARKRSKIIQDSPEGKVEADAWDTEDTCTTLVEQFTETQHVAADTWDSCVDTWDNEPLDIVQREAASSSSHQHVGKKEQVCTHPLTSLYYVARSLFF